MFSVEPYKSNKDKFNIRGVFRPSPESGMDQPRQHSFKSTTFNASFNAFDLDRYMLIEDSHALHRMAAEVPYDTIVVLVNSTRYGGGSMCLDYCVTTVDNASSLKVFIHEFGHSFAYLADEYVGDVAYNDYYHQGVEPLEPNITVAAGPKNVKWKSLLTPGVKHPDRGHQPGGHPSDSNRDESSTRPAKGNSRSEMQGSGRREKNAIPDAASRESAAGSKRGLTQARRANWRKISNAVGAFEGAGYISKGMYRPQLNCIMGNNPKNEFCAPCRQGIQTMIDHFAR